MTEVLLTAEDISFSYHSFPVLHNLSLTINTGEVFCLLGPNGSGKTTLLDCFLGLNKPSSGTIRVQGRDIATLSPTEIARSLAYIPQSHQKNFPFTVLDVVMMGRTAYTGFFDAPGKEDRRKAEQLIEKMNLENLSSRDYTHLSGGESQLVMIMRALVQESPLLIMDEPASHLDFRNEMLLLEMIINIIKEGGRSVVLTTHSPYIAFFLENHKIPVRAGLLDRGRLIDTGTPSQLLSPENMEKVFGVKTSMVESCTDEDTLKSLIPIRSIKEDTK